MDIDLDTDHEALEDDVYAEGDYDDDTEADLPLLLRQLHADRRPLPAPRPAYVPPSRPADVRSIIRAAQADARTELRPRTTASDLRRTLAAVQQDLRGSADRTVVADVRQGQLARRFDDQSRRIDELIRIDQRRTQDSQRAALLTAAAATIPLFFL
jgi:hypothetical protein